MTPTDRNVDARAGVPGTPAPTNGHGDEADGGGPHGPGTAGAASDAAAGGAADRDRARTSRLDRMPTAAVVAALTAVVALPLVVALAALRSPRWYPLLDLAMTEMRVRDVGSGDSPLIGLVGRLSFGGNQGSHPGPVSFWALAPVYRLLGSTAWSLLVGVVVLNTTAVALTLWIAVRRGGARLAVAVAAALAVLLHLYGTQVLTEPWNPYMPVMWWPLTLVALWAVLCDDLPMLPIAVFAGSFCMQTHISYLGLVGGMAGLAVAGLALRAVRLRGDRPALLRLARWAAVSVALGVVLWLPPLIDQLTNDPGNASIVIDHFRHSDEDPIGLRRGGEIFGVHLNPWRLLAGQHALTGSVLPGLALVGAWLTAAVITWRLPAAGDGVDGTDDVDGGTVSVDGDDAGGRERRGATPGPRTALLRLHVVVAAALVLGLVSASRILGFIWHYLTLWAWGTTALILVAIGWTAVAVVTGRSPARRQAAGRGATALAGLVLVVWTSLFVLDAREAEPTQHRMSETVGDLTVPVLDAVDTSPLATGRDGSYRVTWTDGTYIGAPGFGLFLELERRGLDVGVAEPVGPGAVGHRVMPVGEADAEIHLSVGPDIAVWEARPEAVMVAYADPRTEDEQARFAEARRSSIAELERLGRTDLVPLVDLAPFMLFLDDSLPAEARELIAPLGDIGQPLAVFVSPPVSP